MWTTQSEYVDGEIYAMADARTIPSLNAEDPTIWETPFSSA